MWRREWWILATGLAIVAALGVLHSIIVPLLEAPDEIWHFSFVQVIARDRALPVQSAEEKNVWLRESGQPPLYHILGAWAVAPFDQSDFPGFVRFNLSHPALNPASSSTSPNVFIHTPYEEWPYRGSVMAIHVLRLLGVGWGVGTVLGTYWVAREVLPGRRELALAAACVAGLHPHFLFISGVINNDAAASCLCTWVLWLCVRLAQVRVRRRETMALGVLLGLALLSKVSALALLPLLALALGLAWWHDRDWRALSGRAVMVSVLALAVAGWWYVRNWVLYGDPLGWSIWLQDIGVQRITPDELLHQFGDVFASFWEPYEGLFPDGVLWTLGAMLAVAAVGWVVLGLQVARLRAPLCPNPNGLLLAGTWLVLLFASLIRYMTTTPSAEGRLLFPAIASFALLLVVGWDTIVPARKAKVLWGFGGSFLLVLSVASPVLGIRSLFARPVLDEEQRLPEMVPLGVTWDDLELLGVRADPDRFAQGETVELTVYWHVLDAPPANLQAVVRLWSTGGRLLGQRDQVPAGEVYPPDLWRKGEIVRDTYRIRVEFPGPALCQAMVSARAGDITLGEAMTPVLCTLSPPSLHKDDLPSDPVYVFGERVKLVGHELVITDAPALQVTLYWDVIEALDRDYQVFVHLLDGNGRTIGQGDGPPLEGDYPTGAWAPGELLADPHLVSLEDGIPLGGQLLVGLYHTGDGVRLPVSSVPGERMPDDAVRIDLEDTGR